MPLGATTGTATATTMAESQTKPLTLNQRSSRSPPPIDDTFYETQCLFCNSHSDSLNENITHMSKFHGLHIELTHLLVDTTTLLEYFHLIITEECLYCGTQRNSRQAVQQHMLAKGHCKYDVEDEEFADFYDSTTADDADAPNDIKSRISKAQSTHARTHPSSTTAARRPDRAEIRNADPSSLRTATFPSSPTPSPSSSATEATDLPTSARALKLQSTLQTHLSNLSASDRATLAHLPPAQQRAVLATQTKQLATAQRTEKVKRTRLETAANHGGRLDSIRLKRVPPHFGCVGSLNR